MVVAGRGEGRGSWFNTKMRTEFLKEQIKIGNKIKAGERKIEEKKLQH